MPTIIPTPETISITPRRLELDFDGLEVNFIHGNPVLSAFACALSSVFPLGERQFIKSVRYYQDQVTDPIMKQRVRAFIGQEAHHGNLHEKFNDKLLTLGWRTDLIENQARVMNKLSVYSSPERQLAQTVALEHLTALFADYLMNNPWILGKPAHPDVKTMFIWHAIEETEHKAVAYDLYQSVVGDHKIRINEMKVTMPVFFAHMMEATFLLLLKNKNLEKRGGWRQAWQMMYGKEGAAQSLKAQMQAYYKEDFHPWQDDNSGLASDWLTQLAI